MTSTNNLLFLQVILPSSSEGSKHDYSIVIICWECWSNMLFSEAVKFVLAIDV